MANKRPWTGRVSNLIPRAHSPRHSLSGFRDIGPAEMNFQLSSDQIGTRTLESLRLPHSQVGSRE